MATARRSSTKKAATREAAGRKKDAGAKRAPNQGLMKADNTLQDAKNRRLINADARLRLVFGGKQQVSMFELAKLVSGHVR